MSGIEPTTPSSHTAQENTPDHWSEFIPVQKWVRGFFNGQAVVDSRRTMLLRESDSLPVYYFPREDVLMDNLQTSQHSDRSPSKGVAVFWHLKVGDQQAENAAWNYPHPPSGAPDLEDYIAFEWAKMGSWFEEDEQVFVHPRDPFTRIDALLSSRHVKVILAGQVVAESNRPVLLFETGLPVRYYLPKLDINMKLLENSSKVTHCPYKGDASHYSMRVGGKLFKDILWCYPSPYKEVQEIKNMLAFYQERIDDFFVDCERLEKPETPWS
jgi:uncharacterized protein (DUF427 family)